MTNKESLDKAAQAYLEVIEGPAAERIRFLQGLADVQFEKDVSDTSYQPADATAAEESLVSGQPLFLLSPPSISADDYSDMVKRIADYVAESSVLPAEQSDALKNTDFAPAISAHIEHAPSHPAEFAGLVVADLVTPESALTEVTLGFVLHSALMPFLAAPAAAAIAALGEVNWQTWGSGDCPVCGSPAAMGVMGESSKHQGAQRELWCSTCDAQWGYDRMRCVRCGSRKIDSLRYVHLEEDSAHRAHLCEECKGYIKIVFTDDLSKPLSMPVEDAASAEMDAVARSEGYLPDPALAADA